MIHRSLKTETRTRFNGKRVHFFPRLILQGNWLEAAGFPPGQMVQVIVKNGKIEITPSHGKAA